MNKFLKTSIITGAMIMGISSMSFATFSDMENHPETYMPAINYLSESGAINGYPDNTFKPEKKVKRAEFAKIISLVENLKLNEDYLKGFDDLSGHWAEEYINLAVSNGLLKGYDDGQVKPEKEITYGELATIMLRTVGIYEINNENVKWPDDYMAKALELGLFNGVATNDLIPINPARRDNVALVVYNTILFKKQLIEDENKEEVSGDVAQDSEKEQEPQEIDTKKIYSGTIEVTTKRKGEQYITVKDFEGNDKTIKLNRHIEVPKLHSLILYKLSSKGAVRLEKILTIDDLDKDYLLVEEAEDNVAKLKDIDTLLDLESKTFEYDDTTIKFSRYKYYLADMIENEEGKYEFADLNAIDFEDIRFADDDRIIFDYDSKLAFIIRGIEE